MVNVSFSPYQQKIINVLDHQALFSFFSKSPRYNIEYWYFVQVSSSPKTKGYL